MSQYRELFISEATEYINLLNNCLLELEKRKEEPELINEIFRVVHTIKGLSSAEGIKAMVELTHQMENLFALARKGKKLINSSHIDILLKAADVLEELLKNFINEEHGSPADLDKIIQLLQNETVIEEEGPEEELILEKEPSFSITVILDESCVLKGVRAFMVLEALKKLGEIIKTQPSSASLLKGAFDNSFKVFFSTGALAEEIDKKITSISEISQVVITPYNELKKALPKTQSAADYFFSAKMPSVRVNVKYLDELFDTVSELLISHNQLGSLISKFETEEWSDLKEKFVRLFNTLYTTTMQLRTVSLEQIFSRFARIVRDLAKEKEKEVSLEVKGKEIEVDRSILDEISDPLLHLLRNSVDHGIEKPEDREQSGKERAGKVILSADREKDWITITVSDDGRGIDTALIKQVIIKKGLLTEEAVEKLTARELISYITKPGFSTLSSEQVSQTSGRGVGMDVVKKKVEAAGGNLQIETELGKGTVFKIRLPLNVSITEAILVKVTEEILAVPLSKVVAVYHVFSNELEVDPEGKEYFYYRREKIEKETEESKSKIIPLVRLSKVFNLSNTENSKRGNWLLIIDRDGQLFGLGITYPLDSQPIVIKPFNRFLRKLDLKGFLGATILGSGKPVLVLDIDTLELS